jgi:hypothetical protein
MTNDERMQRESSLIAATRKTLSEFAKAYADETELVLLHQDAPSLEGLGIDLLVEINPKHPRKKCQHGGEGQEHQDRPDCNLVQTPLCQGPECGAKNKDEGKAQAVTDVHRSEKISRLPIEVETAGETAIVHFREAPING